jgi:hypothetical protein
VLPCGSTGLIGPKSGRYTMHNRIVLAAILLLAGAALLTSCAATEKAESTPYQPNTGLQGGYSDAHVEGAVYWVQYTGNLNSDAATVQAYFYRRAKELCVQNGYRDFELLGPPLSLTSENTYESNIQCVK